MSQRKVYYFDNAATSWPKPEEVYHAVDMALRTGGSPGRSGHQRTLAAERLLYEAREKVARFFGAPDPASLIFTLNATDALNMAIKGFVNKGDHVLTTPFEHNSVARPLNAMARAGLIEVTEIPCAQDGTLDLSGLADLFQANTSLVIATHASNVSGQLLPVEKNRRHSPAKGSPFPPGCSPNSGSVPPGC